VNGMIPKIIHYCWLSGDPYPENIENCIQSWKKVLPDYEFKLWNANTFDVHSVKWVEEAFECKKYAFAADYIRFWCLYNYGGIYLDSDIEVLKSYEPFLKDKSFMGFEYLGIPEAATIGAEPGLPWVKKCLDYYDGKSFKNEDGSIRNDAVPYMVRLVLKNIYGIDIRDKGCVQDLGDLTLYPYKYFSPKNYYNDRIECGEETVSIHRFASAWGPMAKRKWVMLFHRIVIGMIGKKRHDIIYRNVRPFPDKFNGFDI